jgi:arsenite-transporting ATPase
MRRARAAPNVSALVLPLTIVGGKGGVGKTTVACALASVVADRDSPVLVVSSDPAPSIGDVLGVPVPDEETAIPARPGLFARQMDASAAFERFRRSYADRVDAVFAGITRGALELAHDRAVMRDLMALAPPGIDELYALIALGEMLAEGRFSRIIVDPAPTGHLLRLLEMPEIALTWSHRLMRIMLDFKDVAALGDAAQDVLDFARRSRSLRALLEDPGQCTVIVVCNDEPVVRAESVRLVAACRARGVRVSALVWNRVHAPIRPLSDLESLPQFEAPMTTPAPHGALALHAWTASWRSLEHTARA